MPDLPAPDAHDPHAEFVSQLRRLLADPRFQRSALDGALDYAQAMAFAAWEGEEGRPPVEQLLLALQAAAEALEGIGAALAAGEGEASTEG